MRALVLSVALALAAPASADSNLPPSYWAYRQLPDPKQEAKAQALMHLAGQSFNLGCLGAEGFECLSRLVASAQCYQLEYSDLDDVLEKLERLTAD